MIVARNRSDAFARVRALIAAAAIALCAPADPAAAQETAPAGDAADSGFLRLHDPLGPCAGDCRLHLYAGRFIVDYGLKTYGLDGFEPLWDSNWADSGIVAAAVSRPVVSFGEYARIDAELGAAQRFGEATSQEIWAALYLRWTYFPWNDYLHTSIGVSTGLSYALRLDALEVAQSTTRTGSNLMHFLSPEIAFSLPDRPDVELVLRIHHRSGGGRFILGKNALFNETDGGAQYGTVGLRFRF